MTSEPHLNQSYVSPYSQRVLSSDDHSPLKSYLHRRKQQLNNQKQIQNRLETAQKQKTEMVLYAGSRKSLEDINVTMGLDIITARNYELTSLKGLDLRPDLKSLNLHHNYLVSFKYLQSQPLLEEFHAPMNTICSFYGFSYQPKLKWINLNGNPVIKHGLYRIMCLIAGNLNTKMIGKKPVLYKEKQLAENYLSLFPLARDAIRAGWLIDLDNHPVHPLETQKGKKKPTFEDILQDFQSIDMDDAETVKQTDQFQRLIHGEYSKWKFDHFEKWVLQRIDLVQKKKSRKSGSKKRSKNSVAAKDHKIKSLKKRIDKLKLDLKQQRSFSQQQIQLQEEMREKLKQEIREEMTLEMKSSLDIPRIEVESDSNRNRSEDSTDNVLTVDDIVNFDVLQCHSFAYVFNQKTPQESRSNKVKLRLSADSCIIITQSDMMENEILYSEIQKSVFYLGDSGLSRLHIGLTTGDTVDLYSRNLDLAKSAFKALHMFIEAYKHSIKRAISPSNTPSSSRKRSDFGSGTRFTSESAAKQAWGPSEDELADSMVNGTNLEQQYDTPLQNGVLESENPADSSDMDVDVEAAADETLHPMEQESDSLEASNQYQNSGSSRRQLSFDELELAAEDAADEMEENGQQEPIEIASTSYNDESMVDDAPQQEEDTESHSPVNRAMDEDHLVSGKNTTVFETDPTEEDVIQPADSEENVLLARGIIEQTESMKDEENVPENGEEMDTEMISEPTGSTSAQPSEQVSNEEQVLTEDAALEEDEELADQEGQQTVRFEEDAYTVEQSNSALSASHEESEPELEGPLEEETNSVMDDEQSEEAQNMPEAPPMSTPLLKRQQPPKQETPEPTTEEVQLKPGEESEEEKRAREAQEARERRMQALMAAFQERSREYGLAAANEWLQGELSKLSPDMRMRKELEVLERYHLVKEARKLFEEAG